MDSVLTQANELITLAHSRTREDRERLIDAVTGLCARNGEACRRPDAQAMLTDIFMSLVVQAEREIRQRLAERLSSANWAPPALISVLALDDIDIARPVIARSPVLKDHDLVRLLVEATLEHQIEVARRPGIGAVVVNAIMDLSQPAVLIALAGNDTAEISPFAMRRLVAAAERIAALRGALAQHPKLTKDLAEALYGFVGEAVRAGIASRFKLDPKLLSASVEQAVGDALDEAPQSASEAAREREDMERRLVSKLMAAGQLRAGYLLRSLREGRLVRFEAALASIGEFSHAEVKAAVNTSAEALALACAAVGIDRSVFPTILTLVRSLNAGRPPRPASGQEQVEKAFTLDQAAAAQAFRAKMQGV